MQNHFASPDTSGQRSILKKEKTPKRDEYAEIATPVK
jgi:preprotein translocase subunit Sss1